MVCEDALICDFAQYYHIHDMDKLAISRAAVLACGLPMESRTMMKLSGQKYKAETGLMMGIFDILKNIEWLYKKVHSKRGTTIKKPESIFRILGDKKDENDIRSFRTGEDFEREREKLIRGDANG